MPFSAVTRTSKVVLVPAAKPSKELANPLLTVSPLIDNVAFELVGVALIEVDATTKGVVEV